MSVAEQSVSGHEIIVPSNLPSILKEFCKAAIRTQPYDLLQWSSSYFRALADGEEPPTKLRLEYPPPNTASGLTLGFLRILLRQFGGIDNYFNLDALLLERSISDLNTLFFIDYVCLIFETILLYYNKSLPVETILRRWDCLCLDRRDLNLILMIGKFRRKCQVKKFLAIAVGLLGSSLLETMVMICELFTYEPDGGSAMVPVTLFLEIYGYLAGLRCDGSERDPADEDPTEFIVCDSDYLEDEGFNKEKCSLDRACSVASQDTEADVNLDLELVSREDVDSSRSDITPQLSESYTNQKKMIEDEVKRDSFSEGTLKMEPNNENFITNIELSKKAKSYSDQKFSKDENASMKNMINSSSSGESYSKKQNVRSMGDGSGSERRKKKKAIDPKLLKYYPNIPGIGARLSAEEVASVAIWLNECARVQKGMVGPRNLRHMNCPPLDRHQVSES
ncbi:Ropporin-1-like protein [Eufriesea mexicana]|uniref:Ropporin-1-like protein n=1 Tax=Eufriesea mexicana TaxID=516756 RepID=A0A310ST97_9HYME|nr:Ropporin-1-like protein [Eufriesea mexicana]